ncbi:Cysteine-rich secretory protein family protein [Natronincola peptidivorans]|uniref:Cysteine-rich secretory protein family protein n=1 Tax=Natronincola peptidivorans TaxID=426128 RepID=A0A1I0DJN8_9FIRM|nr:CAP-associated domain-containing protein [Natronincola peptidivorans]SET32677.1 Cysteine-rich secretory protein family protein [Natronincola peptidivorans]
MRLFKRLILFLVIGLTIAVYKNPSLIIPKSQSIIMTISSTKLTDWYNNNLQVMPENNSRLKNAEANIRSKMRYLLGSLDNHILKGNPSRSLEEIEKEKNVILLEIAIGDSVEKVISTLGQPNRKDESQYGFQWYIYNGDYSKYLQVGIQEDKVVGIYTNSPQLQTEGETQIGADRVTVEKLLGKPLEYLKKDNTMYYLSSPEEYYTYLIYNYYATIFFDIHNNNKVIAIQLIEKNTEEALKGFYGKPTEELKESFEKQVFDLANATRVHFNLPQFQWDQQAMMAARKQSKDMAKRNFFDHKNPNGEGPSDRLEKEGISWRTSGENIAAGQTSAIFAHQNWMNSIGHRENILGSFERLGVGVYFGGNYNTYYTQKFYSPY